MPVAERPARVCDKGRVKFKEKKRMGRFVELLVFGMLVMITSDAAMFVAHCAQHCPVRMCLVAEHDGQGILNIDQNTKYNAVVMNSVRNMPKHVELGYAAKSNQDYLCEQNHGSESSAMLESIDWDDGGEDTDATNQKNGTVLDYVSAFFADILRDFALYKDQDADDILDRNEIIFEPKEYALDSIVYAWSF